MSEETRKLIERMTLEEKAGLCSGADFWHTKEVRRLGIPPVMVSDGPNGLRKQTGKQDHLGMSESVKAVCFPTGSALGSSFNPGLVEETGRCLGTASEAEGLHTILGPAVNIKRTPLCGRNFEYISEDPLLTGILASSYVKGVQSTGTGVCVKHFATNNQEDNRMAVNVVVSERALREIYLRAFEIIVRTSKPWSVMGAYNLINGIYCCENGKLLKTILRSEWGFDGIVVTDWGAMNNRCRALEAGLDLEMPSSKGKTDREIVEAVRNGELPEDVLDETVEKLLDWIRKGRKATEAVPYDLEYQHEVARRGAEECAVLLKNNGILPLKKGTEILFTGEYALKPRYQGGGSSHVNSFRCTGALDAAKTYAAILYVENEEAVRKASEADAVVIFAGLPDSWESEGYDRTGLELPEEQNDLIAAVAAVQPNTVVVLHNGSPVTMPWLEKAAAVLEMNLSGEASGEAVAAILFGEVNPSGRLAETYPLRLEDTPAYLNYPGDGRNVYYREDIYVGYRWYDARRMDVLFPFGYGLSYTTFEYRKLVLNRTEAQKGEDLTASVTIRNTGKLKGKEVVQLYVHTDRRDRPPRIFCGFEKVALEPGEEKTVTIPVDPKCLAYYDEEIGDWYTPSGTYTILAGSSSRDLPLTADILITTKRKLPLKIEETTTVSTVLERGTEKQISALKSVLGKSSFMSGHDRGAEALGEGTGKLLDSMMLGLPLHALTGFGGIGEEEYDELIRVLKG